MVVQACREAQAHASFVVLCPSRLPRATRELLPWEAPFPLEVAAPPGTLDFRYGAPELGLGLARTLALDVPDRFLHFVVGLATEGTPPGARQTRLGGRIGMLAPASSVDNYQGAYFGNHVRFVWRENRVRYVATLHTFGERATTMLLGQLVAGLVPTARLRTVQLPSGGAVVGPGATSLAVDATGVWVATAGTFGTGFNGQLVHLNAGALRPDVRAGVHPKGIRVAVGDGAVWAVSYDVTPDGQNLTPPELARVDPSTGRVSARLPLGPGEGTGISVDPGSVWVTVAAADPRSAGVVVRVDPATMRVLARSPVGRGPSSLSIDGRSVWVVNSASNTVTRLDASTGRASATVPVGHDPFAIAIGSDSVWVSNVADNTVSRIDTKTNRVTATIPVGRAPYGMAADSNGVWVAALGAGNVVRIDPQTNRASGRYRLRGDPLAIATYGRDLYVTLNTDGLLLRLDPAKPSS